MSQEALDSLNKFITDLKQTPQSLKERGKQPTPFDYEIRISTANYIPDLGPLVMRGKFSPLGYPVIYGAPDQKLMVACFGNPKFGCIQDPYYFSLKSFVKFLKGSEVEADTSNSVEMDPAPPWFWNNWKNGGYEQVYRDKIYPAVLKTINQRDREIPPGPTVDLFGGDGEFVEMLYKATLLGSERYYILDNHQPSLDKARQRANVSNTDTIVVCSKNLAEDATIFEDITQPSVVTAIGGLCASIVDRAQARKIASQVYNALQDRGLFVVTGFTPVVLNAADFSEIGFKVEQMSVPENAISFKRPDQLYVLRK